MLTRREMLGGIAGIIAARQAPAALLGLKGAAFAPATGGGFIEGAYLDCNGKGGCIDTGVFATGNTVAEIDYMPYLGSNNDICGRNISGNRFYCAVFQNNKLTTGYASGEHDNSFGATITNTRRTITLGATFKVDDTIVRNYTPATFTSTATMCVFCARNRIGEYTSTYAGTGRCYGLKIWRGDTLVFDGRPYLNEGRPCLCNALTMDCFYDIGTASGHNVDFVTP